MLPRPTPYPSAPTRKTPARQAPGSGRAASSTAALRFGGGPTVAASPRFAGAATLALVLLLAGAAAPAAAADLELRFLDEAWNGETVPEGQQCQKFGGEAVSPPLHVGGIPERANALIVEFSDRDFPPMDNGGHGKFGLEIEPGAGSVEVGSVPGHTSDLPEGFFVVEEHQAPAWDKAGAYLPPCSGGRGNSYYLTVKAVHREGGETRELASGTLEMGKY